jgi:hypothetical protein
MGEWVARAGRNGGMWASNARNFSAKEGKERSMENEKRDG